MSGRQIQVPANAKRAIGAGCAGAFASAAAAFASAVMTLDSNLSLSGGNVDIVPLGGLGEFGMNCMALDSAQGTLLIDCGTTFADQALGVELLHADFRWLEQIAERICGIFLTHGHEDHIGGLPYLLRTLSMPVWGSGHALGLLERRLYEHGFAVRDLELHEVVAGQQYELSPFEVEPIRVSHSIAEATALAIRTEAGIVLHSGDFNFDPAPSDGQPTDVERLAELGDEGVSLLLSDSTNVDSHDEPTSERDVAAVLEQLIARAEARVVVALFASNVQRLLSLGKIARAHGRKICLLGRSLTTHVEVARDRGLLDWPAELLLRRSDAESVPRRRLMVLAGGSQAEANSALVRLAAGANEFLKLSPGDTVLFSSRVIPGREREVARLCDDLLRQQVHVESRVTAPGLHTSGHAHRSEQQQLLNLVRPRGFIPIHGNLHHLLRHAELAREVGVPEVMTTENGRPLRYRAGRLSALPPVPNGRVAIAKGGAVLDPPVLQQRAELACSGVVLATLHLGAGGLVLRKPKITALGVPSLHAGSPLARQVEEQLLDWVASELPPLHRPGLDVPALLRRRVAKLVETATRVRPRVELHLEQD